MKKAVWSSMLNYVGKLYFILFMASIFTAIPLFQPSVGLAATGSPIAYMPIELDQTQTLTISKNSTNDFHMKFTLPQQGFVKITFNRIFGSFGTVMPVDFKLGPGNYIYDYLDINHKEPGEYYLGLKSGEYQIDFTQRLLNQYLSEDSGPWYINLKVEFTPTDSWEIENNDNILAANSLELNKDIFGVLDDYSHSFSEEDWFKFTLEKQENVKFVLKLLDKTNYYSPYDLRIYNNDGELRYIPFNTLLDDGDYKYYVYDQLEKGTYYLGISSSQNIRYQLKLNTIPSSPKVNILADNHNEITGTATPLTSITAEVNGIEIGNTTVNDDGTYQMNIEKQSAGSIVSVFSINDQGRKSEPTIVTVIDKTPPEKPKLNPIDDKTRQISGTAEANSTISFSINGEKIGDYPVNALGNFYIYLSRDYFKAGNYFEFTNTDASKNESETSGVYVLDRTPPITPMVDPITNITKKITGKAEPGTTIIASIGDEMIAQGLTEADGAFSLPINISIPGGSTVKVTSRDLGENESSRTVTVIKEPDNAEIQPFTNLDSYLRINTLDGYAIVVMVNGNRMNTIYPSFNEEIIYIGRQKAGTEIKVLSYNYWDNYGNEGSTMIVSDQMAGLKPTIKLVDDNDTNISVSFHPDIYNGLDTSNLTAFVEADGQVIASGNLKSNGDINLPIPKQSAGTKLNIYLQDDYGKTDTTLVEVTDQTFPVVQGVQDNKSYNSSVTIDFKEGTATLNGQPVGNNFTVTNEGKYNLIVVDSAGNKTTINFTIDKTPPTVKGVYNNSFNNKDLIIWFNEGSAKLNGTTIKSGSKLTKEGSYTLDVTDEAANKRTIKFTLDKKAPLIKLTNTSNTTLTSGGYTNKSIKALVSDANFLSKTMKRTGKTISWPASNLYSSEGVYEVWAKDKAGNTAKATFTIDKKAPSSPKVNKITTNSKTITGTAEKGSFVFVKIGSKTYKTTTTAKGNFTLKISKQKKRTKISVYVQDKAQNKSKVKTLSVQ